MMRRRLASMAFALATAGLACQIVAGIERVEKVPPTPDADAADEAPPPTDPCEHTQAPRAPAKTNAPGEDEELPPFIVAVRVFDLVPAGGVEGGVVLGYDLDNVCTCDTRPFTTADGGHTCLASAKANVCDDQGGIDNAAAHLFDEYRSVIELNSAANINDEIGGGFKTLLIQIAGYNGLQNDPSITVGVFPSDGLFERPPDHVGCDASVFSTRDDYPDGGVWSPVFCGEDKWSVVDKTAIGTSRPLIPVRTGSGWVRDGTFVVQVNDALQVPFYNSVLSLVTGRFVGRIVPLGEDLKPRDPTVPPATEAQKRLFAIENGVIAGRIPARDLLAAAGTLDDPLKKDSGLHLCSTPLYETARSQFCGYLDIASNPQRDLNLRFPCDALSAAFGFKAFPALAGELMPLRQVPNECELGPDDRPVDASTDVIYRCPLPEAGP